MIYLLVDVLAATLSFNQMSPEEGYEAFDGDGDGKVSLDDLRQAVAQLQMGIADADIRVLFSSLEDAAQSGYINQKAWVQAINSANTSDILKSRGVPTAPAPVSENVQMAIDTIAAALVFNELSHDEGYDAFDADEDGQVSLSDLQSAVKQLQLDMSEENSTCLFNSLVPSKIGFINREAWVQAMAGANTDDILKSRGILPGAATEDASTALAPVKEHPVPAQPVIVALDSSNIQLSIDTVAAALVFNGLSPEDGYDAFDADEDGVVSLMDLTSAVIQLQLDISEQRAKALFAHLSQGNSSIDKSLWVQVMSSANTADVLKSRGLSTVAARNIQYMSYC